MPETRQLFQTAYLVNDLDASIAAWSSLYGAGPFVIAEHHRTDTFMYRRHDDPVHRAAR
jgi:hypothetical protein